MSDAKRYLNQVRYIDQNIGSRQQELDNLRTTISSGSDWKQDIVSSSGQARSFADKLVKLDAEITSRIDELVDLKAKVTEQIDKLEVSDHVVILREKYLNLSTFDSIARKLHLSERHVKRLHGDALQAFGEKFKDEIKAFIDAHPDMKS